MNSEHRHPVHRVLAALGSLKLTVVLLGMSIFLVFVGTVAQKYNGIWTVMADYFRCWIALLGGWFPYPGGKLLGIALLVNLVVSHSARIHIQARGMRLLLGLATLAIGLALTWLVISHAFDLDSTQKTINPSKRVTFQLMQGGGAAAVLFVGCWLLFRRKAGIVLLHGGIVILMFSELYTGELAEEGTMSISEGQSVNYVEDNRSSELAIVDDSNATADDVVVVPERLLKRGGAIRLEGLPFDLEVDREKFFKNAQVVPVKAGESNPATLGAGVQYKIEGRREEAGVDTSGRVDLPAAYVTFKDRGTNAPIGTLMTSVRYTVEKGAQTVRAGSKGYRVSLRFKRTYKPYSVYLERFQFERYPGTDKPKDYSSFVRVDDPERGIVRNVRIWMNNPLRYRGDTLYQQGFDPETETSTILQVVDNKVWMAPYVACMIVAIGMLGQFLLSLFGFIQKLVSR